MMNNKTIREILEESKEVIMKLMEEKKMVALKEDKSLDKLDIKWLISDTISEVLKKYNKDVDLYDNTGNDNKNNRNYEIYWGANDKRYKVYFSLKIKCKQFEKATYFKKAKYEITSIEIEDFYYANNTFEEIVKIQDEEEEKMRREREEQVTKTNIEQFKKATQRVIQCMEAGEELDWHDSYDVENIVKEYNKYIEEKRREKEKEEEEVKQLIEIYYKSNKNPSDISIAEGNLLELLLGKYTYECYECEGVGEVEKENGDFVTCDECNGEGFTFCRKFYGVLNKFEDEEKSKLIKQLEELSIEIKQL